MKQRLILVLFVSLFSCAPTKFSLFKSAPSEPPIPVDSAAKNGETVQQVEVPKTMNRDDVPVNVDPDDVLLHGETNLGEEFWLVKPNVFSKPKLYKKKTPKALEEKKPGQKQQDTATQPTTAKPPLALDKAKPSKAWIWWLSIGALVAVILSILYKYVPFLKPLVGGLNKAAEPIADKVGEVAGQDGAVVVGWMHSLIVKVFGMAKSVVQRLIALIRRKKSN